jgi:hypothetical protein
LELPGNWGDEPIANAVNADDDIVRPNGRARLGESNAETPNTDVDGSIFALEMSRPNHVEEEIACQDTAICVRERCEQIEFASFQDDQRAIDGRLTTSAVDDQASSGDDARRRCDRPPSLILVGRQR